MNTIIKLLIAQQPEPPATKPQPGLSGPEVLEKIKDYAEAVYDDVEGCQHEWAYLKALYLKLYCKQKLADVEYAILNMIEPVIQKYVQMDPKLSKAIDGQHMNRRMPDDSSGE